ncbi:Endonuclease/Exonuclease/phosphatase family protein [Arcicella aurantiaca]|uniref:Endonuclease/Exonuclease/phosphatase family protein n=1 Tax=Arcicella aurantiaca TaxID=591202 RepID=A0A316EEE8_9BACT|nr:endonuclease/exonuclease/phosphatase family protein [Arcicella aurantiaca]PWK28571.1 Endonuclease/Exonuclease/phosphatase family protein [Arcicella aurantiaca]
MQRLNFLFWNTNRKPLIKEIANIAKHNSIDVILLAEHKLNDADLLLELNSESDKYEIPRPIFKNSKIKIVTKFSADLVIPVADEKHNRYTSFKIKINETEEILVFGVHLPDNRNNKSESINSYAGEVARAIKAIEEEKKLYKTIVVGDFNLNPYDKGMVDACSFHAIMDSEIVKKGLRVVSGKEYRYFYNPMWSLHGDIGNNVAGSYFYKNAELVNYHWNVFDQVLLGPSLIDNFDKNSLKFIDSDGVKTLLKKGALPNKKYSDHLPLMFTLNFS